MNNKVDINKNAKNIVTSTPISDSVQFVGSGRKKGKLFLKMMIVIFTIAGSILIGIFISKNQIMNPEKNSQPNGISSNQQKNKTIDENSYASNDLTQNEKYDWKEVEFSSLQLAPSYIELYKNEKIQYVSCLDFEGQRNYESLEPSVRDRKELIDGLKIIEDYIYTTPLKDDKSNALEPIKSKYKIEYSNICGINGKYLVVFLTTQQKNVSSYFIKSVHAAGGWLGNSNIAIIDTENKNTKIYERFPMVAQLIDLPKEGENAVLLRFMAYYNCNDIPLVTDKHILIKCSGNLYSMDLKNETFEELAICGSKVKNGSYISGNTLCLDKNGTEYLYKDAD